jgi:hypothetical protein
LAQVDQDWFTKAERSSGFRPYLIFLLIASGLSLVLLTGFRDLTEVRRVGLGILGVSFTGFVVLFALKAFQDPDFCRSETYVHQKRKLELEYMGTESAPLPGEVIEGQVAVEAPKDTGQIAGYAEPDDEE